MNSAQVLPGSGSTISFRAGIHTSTGNVHCWVAADNASAHLDFSAPMLTSQQWDEVLNKNFDLAYGDPVLNPTGGVTYNQARIRPGTLLAPALAR